MSYIYIALWTNKEQSCKEQVLLKQTITLKYDRQTNRYRQVGGKVCEQAEVIPVCQLDYAGDTKQVACNSCQ